jgi:hypothetical protein
MDCSRSRRGIAVKITLAFYHLTEAPVAEQSARLEVFVISEEEVARPERVELPTFWFVARRSIQLSYGRISWN